MESYSRKTDEKIDNFSRKADEIMDFFSADHEYSELIHCENERRR